MCMSSPSMPETKAPAVTPAPTPAPLPSAEPTASTSGAVVQTDDERKKRLKAMRQGLASTIKTSPLGIIGTGEQTAGKTTLGS